MSTHKGEYCFKTQQKLLTICSILVVAHKKFVNVVHADHTGHVVCFEISVPVYSSSLSLFLPLDGSQASVYWLWLVATGLM